MILVKRHQQQVTRVTKMKLLWRKHWLMLKMNCQGGKKMFRDLIYILLPWQQFSCLQLSIPKWSLRDDFVNYFLEICWCSNKQLKTRSRFKWIIFFKGLLRWVEKRFWVTEFQFAKSLATFILRINIYVLIWQIIISLYSSTNNGNWYISLSFSVF